MQKACNSNVQGFYLRPFSTMVSVWWTYEFTLKYCLSHQVTVELMVGTSVLVLQDLKKTHTAGIRLVSNELQYLVSCGGALVNMSKSTNFICNTHIHITKSNIF